MSALDCIKVSGYKSIVKLDLELKSLNVLIGANGAGKSNFISLFLLLNQVVEGNFQVYVLGMGGADTILSYGQKRTDAMNVYLQFGSNTYSVEFVPAVGDTLIFKEEQCSFIYPTGYPYDIILAQGTRETGLIAEAKAVPNGIARIVLESLRSWKVYHFHDTSSTAKVKQTSDLHNNRRLRPDGSNLAAFLYFLREQHRDSYDNIVQIIRLMAPFFDDFSLQPLALNPNKIQLEWRERGTDAYFNAHALSDGTLRFMCLTTLLLQPYLPTTILIDEPELGLHPYAITLLADMLKSASKRTQVIVSTQSVTLVNKFDANEIVVVDRDKEGSTFRRLEQDEIEDWLSEYSLGELWEKNVLGGRPQK